jgi:Uri superfamily endonuclease
MEHPISSQLLQIPIQPLPGTYALLMHATQMKLVRVGELGLLSIQPGHFIYVGSALGPGGLSARLSHHLNPEKRFHWHIDYLLQKAVITKIWYTYNPIRQEHNWARHLQSLPGAFIPLNGFGSSDCRCQAHLFYFPEPPDPLALEACEFTINRQVH